MNKSRKNEQGVASILTVVFFLLLASVVTIGFARLTLIESQQALQDSLSKSALAAAYSGVNDAKRALLFCLGSSSVPGCEAASLNNQSCPGFFGNTNLRNKVGIDYDSTTDSVRVGDGAVNERYTCVTIQNDTYDVIGSLQADDPSSSTTIIPLKGTADFDQVRISWQRPGPTKNLTGLDYGGNTTHANYQGPDADDFGGTFAWNNEWPALLRASIYAHPDSGINYNVAGVPDITDTTAFLYPYATGDSGPLSLTVNRRLTKCVTDGQPVNTAIQNGGTYMCQLTVTLPAPPFTHELYLQLSSLYVDTDFSVELLNSGTGVKFDNVSPEIDSTGAVEDTFRRVKVRLSYQGSTPIMPYAIDTGAGLCKNFMVGGIESVFDETCGYSP